MHDETIYLNPSAFEIMATKSMEEKKAKKFTKSKVEKTDDMMELEDLLKSSQDYIENIYCRNKREDKKIADNFKKRGFLAKAFGGGDDHETEE